MFSTLIFQPLLELRWTQFAELSALLSTCYFIYNIFFHPLAKIPGPLSARLGLSIWRPWHAYCEDYAWSLKTLHDIHGDAVRIGRNHVSLTHPEAVQVIYAHGSDFAKTSFYRAFQVLKTKPSLFSDIDPASHSSRRRSVAHAYTMTSLIQLEAYVDPCVELLLRSIDCQIQDSIAKKGDTGAATVDITRWAHFFAMDAVGELAFGRSFDLLKTGSDPTSFLLGVTNLSLFGSIAGSLTPFSSLCNWALPRLTGQPGGWVIGARTSARLHERYEDVRLGKDPRADMLTKFMAAKYSGKDAENSGRRPGDVYNQQDVLFTATSIIAAGSDTTSAALSATLYYLVKNPAAYARLQAEIDDAFDSGRIEFPVLYAAGVKLEYLQACIKEALRLNPPISMELPRYVPDGDGVAIGGRVYPAGTVVGVSAYAFHRSRAAFGHDADVYLPERWLDISDEERSQMERNNLAFGGGSRQCIGKNISLMELNKVLPALLWRYSFSFSKRDENWRGRGNDGVIHEDEPWKVCSSWFLAGQDLWCDVTRRPAEDHDLGLA